MLTELQGVFKYNNQTATTGKQYYFNSKSTGVLGFGNNTTGDILTFDGTTGTETNTKGLRVTSASGDQQMWIYGTSPAYRLYNSISSPTIAGFVGMATAVNNFIQGTASGDMAIGTSTGGNIFIGTASGTINPSMVFTNQGYIGISSISPTTTLTIGIGSYSSNWPTQYFNTYNNGGTSSSSALQLAFNNPGTNNFAIGHYGQLFSIGVAGTTNPGTTFSTTPYFNLTQGGNVLIGTTTDNGEAKVQVSGKVQASSLGVTISGGRNETITRFYTATSNTVLTATNAGAGNTIVVVVEYIGDYDYSGTYQTSGIVMASARQSNGGTWSQINNTIVSKTISGGIDCSPTLTFSSGVLTLAIGGSVELVAKISITWHNMSVSIN